MNHSRHNFLADSALAAHEHWHIHWRDLQDLLAYSYHLRARSQKTQILGNLIAVVAKYLVLRRQFLLLPRFQHRRIQFRFLKWLGQIVMRADPNRLHHRAHFVGA